MRTTPAYQVDKELGIEERQPILTLSWDTIHAGIDVLAHMIKPYKPHLLVGIARGGLIPATLLSHKLNVPLEVIHASSYQGTRRSITKPVQIDGWLDRFNTPNTVVVDDIMDTGDTWNAILYGDGRLGCDMKARLVTLMAKSNRRFAGFNDYFMHVPSHVWVKFPWEGDES